MFDLKSFENIQSTLLKSLNLYCIVLTVFCLIKISLGKKKDRVEQMSQQNHECMISNSDILIRIKFIAKLKIILCLYNFIKVS